MTEAFLPFCKPAVEQEDIDAVVAVLKSGWITTGPKSAELEKQIGERVGAKHAVAMTSATAAMHVYLEALGIGPGDEVITPSLTWVSAINLVSLMGATPVFIDIDRDTLMVDAAAVEAAITPRTKLIIPVHYAGAPLDMDPLRALAQQRGIPLLEDAAHSLGTLYKGRPVGSSGDAVFSLQAIKNVTSAEGGVFVTNDDELAERVRQLKFHGLGVDAFDREQQGRSPQAEVLQPGFKYNLPDMCAALALSQLQRLDEINARRREIAEFYRDAFASVDEIAPLALPAWEHRHAWHLFVVRVLDNPRYNRDDFLVEMKKHNIGCGLHFRAVHSQKFYREQGGDKLQLPNTDWNSDRICSIPLFPHMTIDDAQRVVTVIKQVLQG